MVSLSLQQSELLVVSQATAEDERQQAYDPAHQHLLMSRTVNVCRQPGFIPVAWFTIFKVKKNDMIMTEVTFEIKFKKIV